MNETSKKKWYIEVKGGGCFKADSRGQMLKTLVNFYGSPGNNFSFPGIKEGAVNIKGEDMTLGVIDKSTLEAEIERLLYAERLEYYSD